MASADDAELAEMLMGTFVDDGVSDDEALELEQVSEAQASGRARQKKEAESATASPAVSAAPRDRRPSRTHPGKTTS